jgi:competence protein ComEA
MSHRHLLLPTALRALLMLGLVCSESVARAEPPATAAPLVVNINTASAEELERLPGIGPTRARAILQLRAQRTRFTRIEELLRVKGIGRATFRKLRPHLVVSGPTTLDDHTALFSG